MEKLLNYVRIKNSSIFHNTISGKNKRIQFTKRRLILKSVKPINRTNFKQAPSQK